MNRLHLFNASDEAIELGKALPEGFDAGFAVAFAGEEAAEHGDAADDFAQSGHFWGGGFSARIQAACHSSGSNTRLAGRSG